MNKYELITLFDSMTPVESQKSRMLNKIFTCIDAKEQIAQRKKTFRYTMIPSTAVCMILVIALVIFQPFGGGTAAFALYSRAEDGTVFKLAGHDNLYENMGTSVSYVDSRPGLEFFIEGKEIEKIEISCQTEFIYVVDWTKTLDEKWWNIEKYQKFDEERQVFVFHPELLYEKSITLNFGKDFSDYQDVWYRWTAHNLYKWASEDNFSHFLMQPIPKNLAEEEKKEVAAGQYKGFPDGVGHIQLDGYPKELTEDKITITVTDRQGNSTTSVINVNVSNNELKQTVVTASLSNETK